MSKRPIPQRNIDIPTQATEITPAINNSHPAEPVSLERLLEDHLHLLYHLDMPGQEPDEYDDDNGAKRSLHRKRAEVLVNKLREHGFVK